MSKLLTEEDFTRAAESIGCDIAAIKAVAEVESSGAGFLLDGNTPRILFEAHQFSARTGHKYDATHPNISSRNWNRALYATGKDADERGMKEHKRLAEAVALDRPQALQSASWGKFQVMGFNHKAAGHETIQDFINAAYRSEGAHLDMFINFVKHEGLDAPLRDHKWDRFALGYNGQGYRQNAYDTKLAAAWAKHSG